MSSSPRFSCFCWAIVTPSGSYALSEQEPDPAALQPDERVVFCAVDELYNIQEDLV